MKPTKEELEGELRKLKKRSAERVLGDMMAFIAYLEREQDLAYKRKEAVKKKLKKARLRSAALVRKIARMKELEVK